MSWLNAGIIGSSAQILAALVFIGGLEVFKKINPGKESWPILFPLLIATFFFEVFFLSKAARAGVKQSIVLAFGIVMSWFLGAALYTLGGLPPRLTPKISFVMSTVLLILLVKMAAAKNSSR